MLSSEKVNAKMARNLQVMLEVQIEGKFYVERKSIICNSHSGVKNSYTDAEYFTRGKLSLKLCLFSFYAHANLCATQFHAVSL